MKNISLNMFLNFKTDNQDNYGESDVLMKSDSSRLK